MSKLLWAVPSTCQRMTMAQFVNKAMADQIEDGRGFGRYISDGLMTEEKVLPSHVKMGKLKSFEEVLWFPL